MRPRASSAEDPHEWLRRARSDLLLARAHSHGVYLEDLCFHTQQACEKAFKALLIHRGVRFPVVHDLAQLLTLVDQSGLEPPERVRAAAQLTRFAVFTRYPGLARPVTRDEYDDAVAVAAAVVSWVSTELGAGPTARLD